MIEEITILIADDHPIFRRGLRAVIENDSALKIVIEADDGEIALAEIERLEPNIAVLDSDMPKVDGLTVARVIQAKNLTTRAVFLTMHKDEAIFNAAIDADVKGLSSKTARRSILSIASRKLRKAEVFSVPFCRVFCSIAATRLNLRSKI